MTVRYHGAGSQTPANNVQTATWTRTVTKDKVTGDVVKTTDWTADKASYDAVPSPVIPGYTVDVAIVPAETVTHEDMVKDVYYSIQTQKVTYTVIDDTTHTTLKDKVELTTGNSGANLPAVAQTKYDTAVADYLAQGYELVSKDNLPAQFDTDSNVDQNVVVHLKHKETISSENKTVTETIHYVYKDGSKAAESHKATLDFAREVRTDEVTKTTTKGAWTPVQDTFAEVVSPTIAGYTADKQIVEAISGVTGDSKDVVVKVTYTADKQRVTYTVIDDTTGTTLENQVELTTGKSDTILPATAKTKYDQVVAAYQTQGYELVSKDELPAKFDTDSKVDQNVVIRLKHGTAESQESKKVKKASLTVRYHGAGSQTPANNVQTATWTRTVTKDKVTGDVVKTTDWTADKASYDAVPSPVIPGYTVDVAIVPAETVTQEDMVKDVYYTAVPVTPDKPTPPVVPSTPDKPTTPTVVPTTPTKATPTKTEILPSTGDSQVGSTLATLTGVSLLLSAFGYIGHRKKED
ncbi:MucBP domain protein [Streptococcus constellatus]|uniref:MucBP domain protein n=1 Tax=Streptococcus constellatus TaxID=76860 RepID=A0A564SCR9_STRCV|nr:MucBP domain protein [Streptococcus constellatus]VUX11906.1 MucBP domain protein [Streptococcus gordonii]